MIIEHFKEGRVGEVYRLFADKGRMMPPGLQCVESWITADMSVCYQLMETKDESTLVSWTKNWDDLVDFEFVPVISSAEARAKALKQ